jgi:hypothetical protein
MRGEARHDGLMGAWIDGMEFCLTNPGILESVPRFPQHVHNIRDQYLLLASTSPICMCICFLYLKRKSYLTL